MLFLSCDRFPLSLAEQSSKGQRVELLELVKATRTVVAQGCSKALAAAAASEKSWPPNWDVLILWKTSDRVPPLGPAQRRGFCSRLPVSISYAGI